MSVRADSTRALFHQLLRRLRGGTVEVVDARGSAVFGADRGPRAMPALRARVEVRDERLYERLLREGSVGLGESYADGWWAADDLTAVLRIAFRSLRGQHDVRDRLHRLLTPLIDGIERRHRADRARDARNIRAHYDVGNGFFERMLDETMAYSCAVFDAPDVPLASASIAKFDRIARALELSPRDHLLEIGTGWGGFALHAASTYGCRVTTTTISPSQFEYATARVRAAHLDERVTVLDQHFLDVTGDFTCAAAIEVIEAVDWREYHGFFDAMRRALPDGGPLAMQAIVVPDASFDRVKRHTDFMRSAIFPGGCLPSVRALGTAAEQSGFTRHGLERIGRHYPETLRRWRANLDDMTAELDALGLDGRFQLLWRFYLSYCEAGFDEQYLDDVQVLYRASEAVPSRRPARTRRPRHSVSA